MSKKSQLFLLISVLLIVLIYIFSTTQIQDVEKNSVIIPYSSDSIKKDTIKSELERDFIVPSTVEKNNGLEQGESRQSVAVNRNDDRLNESEVESIFIANNKAIDMSFINAIQDEEIFNLSIEALEQESQTNMVAQQHKAEFADAYADKYSKFLQTNEDAIIDLENIQCGNSSCLIKFSSLSLESFNQFYQQLSNTPDLLYSSSLVTIVQENGGFAHRLLVSMDEQVNGVLIPAPGD